MRSVRFEPDRGSLSFESGSPARRRRGEGGALCPDAATPSYAWHRPRAKGRGMVGMGRSPADENGHADVTNMLSTLSDRTTSSSDEALTTEQRIIKPRRRRSRAHGHRGRRKDKVTALKSQMAALWAKLEQKEVVTRSLQRQLDQVKSFKRVSPANAR